MREFDFPIEWVLAANVFGWALALWSIFIPVPYAVCMTLLALAPLAAIGLTAISEGEWVLLGERGSGRLSLEGLILVCPLAIGLRAISDMQVMDWQVPLTVAYITGILLACAVAMVLDPVRSDRFFLIVFMLAVGVSWGWGVVALTNAAADTAPERVYTSIVQDRWTQTGKSTSYHLRLSPWGPVTHTEDISVERSVYDQAAGDGVVCIDMHYGLFGWRWFAVHHCNPGFIGMSPRAL